MLLMLGLFLLTGVFLHAQQIQPGLYADSTFQGKKDLYSALRWINANAQNGGDYSIVLETDIAAPSTVLNCNGKDVTISLKSSGADVRVTYATRNPSSSLFTIKSGVTFVLEEGVSLVGNPSASRTPVTVDGGNFIMNGGAIRDSKIDANWFGGGVDLVNGTFTMNGGIISGNACDGGCGVYVGENASFTMNSGIITGNTVNHSLKGTGFGGGVLIDKNAMFIMNGGSISSNCADYGSGYGGGGGVYVNGTFIMAGGVIEGNACTGNRSDLSGNGGGVCVSGNGMFIMKEGTIRDNSGRGVYLVNYVFIDRTGGGKFIMDGGVISGNAGGGINVNGAFVMYNGDINENYANSGAGVYVGNGTFMMNGGTISGNKAGKSGGGVLVDGGVFIKSNGAGIIYGSDASEDQANQADVYGHAVYTRNGSRDSTAQAAMVLDSRKQGADGGWE